MPEFLATKDTRIAYHKTTGDGPGVVFLGGFKSDMDGTKALALDAWAKKSGRAFLRFDYGGHGQSSGNFLEGCIGDWLADSINAISILTDGPQILVGSSMGGWIALLICRAMPEKIAGLVGIAAAPDFTEDSMWKNFSNTERETLLCNGQVELPSDYSDEPYIITQKLIEDGRKHLVLRDKLSLPFPVHFLQGTADTDVSVDMAQRLYNHVDCGDAQLTLVKDADHRFSSPDCLQLIQRTVVEMS